MATFRSAQANFGLSSVGSPTRTNVAGSVQVGESNTRVSIQDGKTYSMRAVLISAGDELHLALDSNDSYGSTAFVAGTAQVETATCAGTITGTGTATVTVTDGGFPSLLVTLNVPLLAGDTASVWAGKVRAAMNADPYIPDRYSVGGATDKITLTRLPDDEFSGNPIYPANDATLNIALANGTCTGITAAPTSADTTAGVATSGAYVVDASTDDWEGVGISLAPGWLLLKVTRGTVSWEADYESGKLSGDASSGTYGLRLFGNTGAADLPTAPVFTVETGPVEITVTVTGV